MHAADKTSTADPSADPSEEVGGAPEAAVSSREPRRVSPRDDPDRQGWAVGRWVADRYFLERRLGGGATGDVYLARDRLLKKRVALKVLKRQLAESRDTVDRFLQEVALAHSITHPNVVRIHDTGEAHGMPFFSMEYLQGQPLDQLCAQTEAPMTLREIRDIGRDILQGLSAAHAAGIIHRDLKPANVLLTHRGAIVMDFGVAVPDHAQPTLPEPDDATCLVTTEAGTIFGSPAFMAPELWEGSPPTVQSDLYAFGVMLYQMLAGRLPYVATNARQLLYQIRTSAPTPVQQLRRDVPWNMRVIIDRCMARQPDRRPASALLAANLLTPLAGLRRRRFLVIGALGVTMAAAATPSALDYLIEDADGLRDPVASADLSAAIRSFDAGDLPATTRQLQRLLARSPRSAAAAWWHATVAHSIGNESLRTSGCASNDSSKHWEGSRRWQAWAKAACASEYTLPDELRGSLDRRLSTPHFLPLAVHESLIERSDAARETWPAVRREGEDVAARLATQEPQWSASSAMPIRWQLARVGIDISHGDLDSARTRLDDLTSAYPHSPAIVERSAWLDTLQGRLDRAAVRAKSISHIDPRPLVRALLDDGRLTDAWAEIENAPHLYDAALQEMWCGYAYRFEIKKIPPRCSTLDPGLARALWQRDAPANVRALRPAERSIVIRQRALDRGECFGDDDHRPGLRQISPPFESYSTQQHIASALCLHDPSQRQSLRVRRYLDALRQLTPIDPWVLLLSAQVDEVAGAQGPANQTRQRVAERWANADDDLPLVRNVRQEHGSP